MRDGGERGIQIDRAEIVALDKRHVWHPYTAMGAYMAPETNPFVIDRAEGPYLFDRDGKKYFDCNSSWWVATLGHNHPRLVRALTEQAATMCHVSLAGVTHELAARLASRLARVAPPGLDRVFFSDDGSTALEAAIKMALGYHRNRGEPHRTRFVSLAQAFHGETLGVTALGGVELFRRPFDSVLMRVDFVAPPDQHDEEEKSAAAAALRALFDTRGSEIAAMVVEPLVQGATGMRIYPSWFLRLAREACDRAGALLIVDEVFTGYGRVGPMWASNAAGVVPDLICSAKGFSGGILPMAATLASARVFEAFLGDPSRAFYYGHSYCGHPLGARVALEVLDVLEEEHVLEGVPERAQLISEAFANMAAIEGTSNARSLGMIGAIDLAANAAYLGGAGWRVHAAARERGLYLRPLGDVIYVTPPINTPIEDLKAMLATVHDSVASVMEERRRLP